MTGPLAILRKTFAQRPASDADSEPDDERPETTLHECATCGSVFIQHSGDRCSECGAGPLVEQ